MKQSMSQKRRQQLFRGGRDFLDEVFPLAETSHRNVTHYYVYFQHLCAITGEGICTGLKKSAQFTDFNGSPENPNTILLNSRDYRVQIQIDPMSKPGLLDKAGIANIRIEEAAVNIMDGADLNEAPDTMDDFGLLQAAY